MLASLEKTSPYCTATITCFTSKSSSNMKQDKLELSSPKSADSTPLTGVVIMVPSVVDGDWTVHVGNGNIVGIPSENSTEFWTTLINMLRSIFNGIMISS